MRLLLAPLLGAAVARLGARVCTPALLLALLLGCGALPARGQAPGQFQVRLALPLVDQLSYRQHPFYQITGDSAYVNGKAGTATIFSFNAGEAGENDSVVQRLLHVLPPFGIEAVSPIEFTFPRGFGIGFDTSPIIQAGGDAADDGTPIHMDAYYHSLALRFYFFDPTQPGVNYFVGLGLGILSGTIRAEPVAGATPELVEFSRFPVGSTRLGLESRGENWGFRYELMVLSAREVTLDYNPYLTPENPPIDFGGTLVRLALLYQF